MAGPNERLEEQIAFVLELDGAKTILRRNPLRDNSRRENDAEHMWHLAVMAMVLHEHAEEPVDVCRVLGMLLVHDIVEIDAGDTFIYDEQAHSDKMERERRAAERIFGLLPSDQGRELRALWEEFEARESPDARFAAAIDRLQPLLLNHASGGGAWREHGVRREQVTERNARIGASAPELWRLAREIIADAAASGYLD